jgi:RNA polymerase sigma-70 factor (ECF subfamily)
MNGGLRSNRGSEIPSGTEQALVTMALGGDQKAYKTLFETYRQAIFHIVVKIVHNSEEANDLVQETFIKAFGSLKTYDHNYRFSTWLYKIAANCSIDYLRKRRIDSLSLDKPILTKDGEVQMELPDYSFNPEKDLTSKRQTIDIEAAIQSLPEKYREVIVMRHQEDKSYEEIASQLKVPVGTVKARIFRARELLKKKLKSLR